MPTLYFSYSLPGGSLDIEEPLNSPYTITWNVSRLLSQKAAEHGYTYRYVNLDSVAPITFDPLDIVIGHLWDAPGSFMQQALNADIRAKIILQPYSHYMVSEGDVARYVDMFSKADELLFITGRHWFETMPASPFAALYPKVTRIDMAVSSEVHPYKKTTWNKQGQRAICVIGNDIPVKGFKNVAELARMAGIRLGHFGNHRPGTFDHVPHMTYHGGVLFTPQTIEAVCANFDSLCVLALSDANPTVLLEAAAWGLRVYCNTEAGYLPNQPFEELRLGDMKFNVEKMREFQNMDEYALRQDSKKLRSVIERSYNWDKFTEAVWSKVSEYL